MVQTAFAGRPTLVAMLPSRLRDKVEWSLFKSRLEIEQIRNLAFDAKHGSDTAGEIYDLEEIGVPTDLAQRSTFYRAF